MYENERPTPAELRRMNAEELDAEGDAHRQYAEQLYLQAEVVRTIKIDRFAGPQLGTLNVITADYTPRAIDIPPAAYEPLLCAAYTDAWLAADEARSRNTFSMPLLLA